MSLTVYALNCLCSKSRLAPVTLNFANQIVMLVRSGGKKLSLFSLCPVIREDILGILVISVHVAFKWCPILLLHHHWAL